MFATLLGALPRPPSASSGAFGDAGPDDVAVRAIIETQEAAGLELVSDGRIRWKGPLGPLLDLEGIEADGSASASLAAEPRWHAPISVAEWEFAASCASSATKQALPGPYTAGRLLDTGAVGRERATLALAEALNAELRALQAAGCPLVEIDEPDATRIGDDDSERRLFVAAHRRLTTGLSGTHLSLILGGGNADTAGAETILDAPYSSYAVDLIAGPDTWRLVTQVPGDRGIVCGALAPNRGSDDTRELLVWAVRYAASTGGRGLERVGLANAPGLEREDWPTVERKITRLGEASRLASLTGGQLATAMDPRAVDIRSAALGRHEPGRHPPALHARKRRARK